MASLSISVTAGRPYKKVLAANNNDSSFGSRIPTITEPVNDGVIDLAGARAGGLTVPLYVKVLPYGLGADNDVFDMRVIGWRHIGAGPPQAVALWVPTILLEVTCTISAAVGVATAPVLATERFADTITVKAAGWEPTYTADVTRFGSVRIFSPANDLPAWFVLRLDGEEKLEFTFDQTTGTPTMNCLVAFL